jgi:hypothetical protein
MNNKALLQIQMLEHEPINKRSTVAISNHYNRSFFLL